MSKTAAFFDLDRTLIDANSGYLWAKHERQSGNISGGQMLRAAFWTVLYHFSLIDIDTTFKHAVGHYRGVPFAELEHRTHQWFASEIQSRLRPGAADALGEHRNRGHLLVLLTNSSCFEAVAAAKTWDLDAWLANRFPVDEAGALLGTFERPLCYGPGKVTHAERWADEHRVDLRRSYFYTDSYSDIPMLDRVGEPRVVCPDIRLRRVARSRGWPVLSW